MPTVDRSRGVQSLFRPFLLFFGIIAIGIALHASTGLQAQLHGMASRQGMASGIAFCGLAAVLCAVGVPRQAVAFAAALAFGLWIGCGLAMAAQLAGCAATFLWARFVARDWVRQRFGRALGRPDRMLSRNPFMATLMLRLLPVGNNLLLNLLAGLSAIRPTPFLAASALGYIPQTLIFALLGSGARVGRAGQLGVGVVLFAASALCGLWLMRRRSVQVDD
jgi:uncharacterized membrane protein YdjX (TVP38/TMEM64 family)